MCVEEYQKFPPLGRLVFLDSLGLIGAGIVRHIPDSKVLKIGTFGPNSVLHFGNTAVSNFIAAISGDFPLTTIEDVQNQGLWGLEGIHLLTLDQAFFSAPETAVPLEFTKILRKFVEGGGSLLICIDDITSRTKSVVETFGLQLMRVDPPPAYVNPTNLNSKPKPRPIGVQMLSLPIILPAQRQLAIQRNRETDAARQTASNQGPKPVRRKKKKNKNKGVASRVVLRTSPGGMPCTKHVSATEKGDPKKSLNNNKVFSVKPGAAAGVIEVEVEEEAGAGAEGGEANNYYSVGFTDLPPEIIFQIFSYLDSVPDLQHASMVCRLFDYVALDPKLWRRFCLRDGIGAHYLYIDEQTKAAKKQKVYYSWPQENEEEGAETQTQSGQQQEAAGQQAPAWRACYLCYLKATKQGKTLVRGPVGTARILTTGMSSIRIIPNPENLYAMPLAIAPKSAGAGPMLVYIPRFCIGKGQVLAMIGTAPMQSKNFHAKTNKELLLNFIHEASLQAFVRK
jgi:hypothetical protein